MDNWFYENATNIKSIIDYYYYYYFDNKFYFKVKLKKKLKNVSQQIKIYHFKIKKNAINVFLGD